MSIKINLTGEQFVKGNMDKGLQVYKIYYYPPEQGFPTDKIWLYFNRKQDNKYLGIKSLCFENTENHRKFIVNNIFANLYILEKRLMTYSDIQMTSEYRNRLLEALLLEIKKEIMNRWKKELEEKCQKKPLMNTAN